MGCPLLQYPNTPSAQPSSALPRLLDAESDTRGRKHLEVYGKKRMHEKHVPTPLVPLVPLVPPSTPSTSMPGTPSTPRTSTPSTPSTPRTPSTSTPTLLLALSGPGPCLFPPDVLVDPTYDSSPHVRLLCPVGRPNAPGSTAPLTSKSPKSVLFTSRRCYCCPNCRLRAVPGAWS